MGRQSHEMSQELAERPTKVRTLYDEATIHRALTELAACSGNSRLASRSLAEDGINIEPTTIWRWGNRLHTEQYQRIRAEVLPKIQQAAAEQHMDLALRQAEVSAIALEEIENRLPAMDDRDLINAMGKTDIGSGIHTEKAQLLAGQPTHRVEKSAGEVLRKLKARGMKVVDGQTEEVEVEVAESVSSSGAAVAAQASSRTD